MGISANLHLAPFEVFVQLSDDYRSGYATSAMNGHKLKSMASVSWSFCNNKCMLRLFADDIFNKLNFKSVMGGYKVSLIWLPERMNLPSANKILKLLEEPPSKTFFIMVSEEPELLLETIRSRTQRIDFKKIDDERLEQALLSQAPP